MENQPGFVKDNPMTRLADEIKRANIERGMPAGRTAGVPMVGGPTVRVSSASMLAPPTPLPIEEKAELDRRARDIGILPLDENDEEIGFPAREEIEIPMGPLTAREQSIPSGDRMTAREFMAGRKSPMESMRDLYTGLDSQFTAPPMNPKLIDFKKIQGIDLIRGFAYVDSFDIEIPKDDIDKFKKYVLDLTLDYVTKKLAEAMIELTVVDPIEVEFTVLPLEVEGGMIADGSNQ